MSNATGVNQSALYQMRGPASDGNQTRDRSKEQYHSYNSGNPMNYAQFMNGQDPSLGRYVPPTLSSQSPTNPTWNNNPGGYAYNLPTAFGGFGGFSQFSQNPQQPAVWGNAGGDVDRQGSAPQGMPINRLLPQLQASGATGARPKPMPYQKPPDNPNSLGTANDVGGSIGGPPIAGAEGQPSYQQLLSMLQGSRVPRSGIMQNAASPGGSIGAPPNPLV